MSAYSFELSVLGPLSPAHFVLILEFVTEHRILSLSDAHLDHCTSSVLLCPNDANLLPVVLELANNVHKDVLEDFQVPTERYTVLVLAHRRLVLEETLSPLSTPEVASLCQILPWPVNVLSYGGKDRSISRSKAHLLGDIAVAGHVLL